MDNFDDSVIRWFSSGETYSVVAIVGRIIIISFDSYGAKEKFIKEEFIND